MKKLVLLVFALNICLGTFAQFTPEDTLKYRISLKDKAATDYSLQKPEMYLSKKSIERRKRQGLEIDSTDLPVCKKYVDAIRKKGVHVLVTGKWDNFVTVSCNDSMLIAEIAGLPFVRSTERVWRGVAKRASERDSLINKPLRTDSLYGPAITQIKMSHADRLHEAGFKGQGMTIAVIDAGFHNVDKIEAMKNINILGTRDFVNPEADIYAESSHGMSVLSCMAMNQPNVMIGTAPEASFWLLRSEDEYFTLHFIVTGADPQAFVELLDTQDKVVRRRLVEDGRADFYYLNPGKYAARLINDRNGNGEWDTGDYAKGIQPEEVYYFPKVVEYKALWDVDQNWDIHATPVDKQKLDELKKQKPDEDKKKKERERDRNNQNRNRR